MKPGAQERGAKLALVPREWFNAATQAMRVDRMGALGSGAAQATGLYRYTR